MNPPSMPIPVWVVDAFTSEAFGGNPAAVCIVPEGVPEQWMRRFAAEMRHSETAYLTRCGDHWSLRWFTPEREVDLCGHATLASAHVLWETGHATDEEIRFETRSGTLTCWREDGRVWMRLPAMPAAPAEAPDGLFAALGITPVPVLLAPNGNYLIILEDQDQLERVAPDFRALLGVSSTHGFVLTAPASDDHDVACRYFVPAWGIDEDPVTGSIQCTLGPYWCHRLRKQQVAVRQVSQRGGTLLVRPEGEHVLVGGDAVTVLHGEVAALRAAS